MKFLPVDVNMHFFSNMHVQKKSHVDMQKISCQHESHHVAKQHRHAQIAKLTHSQTSAHPCARTVHQASTLKVQRVYVLTARPGQTTMSHSKNCPSRAMKHRVVTSNIALPLFIWRRTCVTTANRIASITLITDWPYAGSFMVSRI